METEVEKSLALTQTVTLDFPIEVDGKQVKKMTMRRAKLRDRRLVSKQGGSAIDQEIRLFAILCDIPEDCLNEMDETDYLKLQEAYSDFLSGVKQEI